MWRVIALFALGGCNQVFGLEPTVSLDAPNVDPDLDSDGDGVPDLGDNCPNHANRFQTDVDKDTIGDRCDNCPLLVNTTQHDVGDMDGIGDVCDPNPQMPGDCLQLFDSFRDETAFAANWKVAPAQLASYVIPMPGVVGIAAAPSRVAVLSNDVSTATAVQVLAIKQNPDGEAGIATDTPEDVTSGFRCWIAVDTSNIPSLFAQLGTTGSFSVNAFSSEPVDTGLVMRLALPITPFQGDILQCRADYGVAVAATRSSSTLGVPGGMYVGVFAATRSLIVQAIAMYTFNNDGCPDPIVR